jgi:hypothetical protein
MKISKTAIIGACGAVANPLAAFIAYTVFEEFPGLAQWLAVAITGLSIGMLEGIFIARPLHRAISLGTFIGLLIMWSPVVLVTYGFALLALPLLAGFAVLVRLGMTLGNSLRPRASIVR